jgi:hypothetical protein
MLLLSYKLGLFTGNSVGEEDKKQRLKTPGVEEF